MNRSFNIELYRLMWAKTVPLDFYILKSRERYVEEGKYENMEREN